MNISQALIFSLFLATQCICLPFIMFITTDAKENNDAEKSKSLRIIIENKVISVFPMTGKYKEAIRALPNFSGTITRNQIGHGSLDHTLLPNHHWHITFDRKVDKGLVELFLGIYEIPDELKRKIIKEFISTQKINDDRKYIRTFIISEQIVYYYRNELLAP